MTVSLASLNPYEITEAIANSTPFTAFIVVILIVGVIGLFLLQNNKNEAFKDAMRMLKYMRQEQQRGKKTFSGRELLMCICLDPDEYRFKGVARRALYALANLPEVDHVACIGEAQEDGIFKFNSSIWQMKDPVEFPERIKFKLKES
jgi:hypothetical protein